MRRSFAAALVGFAALVIAGTAAAAGSYKHLDPGATANLKEQVPVNIVFVGYDLSAADEAEFLDQLPSRYKAIVRSRLFYGVTELLGLHYTYDLDVVHTDDAWEDTFFAALADLAEPAPTTLFQDIYNDQDGTRDVTDNHFIDAPSVEKWLIDHAPAGVDTSENTVFLVNWWGRDDFIDHVYTKFGEPDPDTGYDFGVNRASRKIIAWGGTTPEDEETGLGARGVNRVWFHDLSAGPESWGGSYDITSDDIDGDGEPDYRLPAAWEYVAGGYRDPSALPSDLGKLVRYAAINLLFTSSPLYPPYLTPPRLPDSIVMDLTTYEGWPGTDASALYQDPALLVDETNELLAVPTTAEFEDAAFAGKIEECYVLWLLDVPCYPGRSYYYPGFANLFLSNALLMVPKQQTVNGEYTAAGFNYATTDDLASGFLGFADDNWIDGTQSMIFNFVSPGVVAAGYGLTTTQIHEYGHHWGMSHPHDGFDWETGIDYGPSGPYFLAWASDESNSMMSYIDLNWDFSQFDRDNFWRFQAAGYITNANAVAEMVLAAPNPKTAQVYLNFADLHIGQAKKAVAAHDYPTALHQAQEAYSLVLQAAAIAKVKVKPSNNGWFVLPRARRDRHAGSFEYSGVDKAGPGTKRWAP